MAFFSSIGVAVGFAVGSTAALVAGIVISVAVVGLLVGVMMMMGGAGDTGSMDEQKDKGVRQRMNTDPNNKLSLVYGNRRSTGMVTMGDITSDDATMFFIIAIAEGPCESIGQVYWGDKLLYFAGSSFNSGDKTASREGNLGLSSSAGSLLDVTNAVGDNGLGKADDFLNGNLRIAAYPQGGRCTQMEANSSRWSSGGSDRTMPNTAYIYLELDYDREKRVTGLESKLGFYLEGKRIKTFESNGSLSTGVSYSKNPGEVLYDYLSNDIYGCGIPDEDIDLVSIYKHSKFCKEEIPHFDFEGNTVNAPRYEINGVVATGGSLDENISDICSNGGGWFTYNQGKFGIVSDKTEKITASDVVDHTDDNDGVILGEQYMITDTGANGSFYSFGADSTPTNGDVFVAIRDSVATGTVHTGGNVLKGLPYTITTLGSPAVDAEAVWTALAGTTRPAGGDWQVSDTFEAFTNGADLPGSDAGTFASTTGDSAFTGEAVRINGVFSEDEMFGGITVSSAGLDNLINRMTVEFPSDTEGQQEYSQVVVDTRVVPVTDLPNPYYINPALAGSLASEDEPLLEQTVKMQLTRGDVQATRIAVIAVNNSRQTIAVEFKTSIASMSLRAGQIIGVRHTTPGWGYDGQNLDPQNPVEAAPKLFRISSVEEEAQGSNISLIVTGSEYASENYRDGVIQQVDPAPNTNFSTTNRAPDIGSITVRPKIQEYLFDDTNLDSIVITVHGDEAIATKDLVSGRLYTVKSLGDTSQASWNTLGGTSGLLYAVDSTYSCAGSFTLTISASAVTAGKECTIDTLGTTSQSEWNTLAGTSNANYVVGSVFTAAVSGSGTGTGTVITDPGTGTSTEFEVGTVILPGSTGSFRTGKIVADTMASALPALALVDGAAKEPYINNGVLVQFVGERVGDATLTGADTAGSRTVQFYDNASISAVDQGVSSTVSGVPISGISVSYRDTDPFLDRVELRWFGSIDVSISMDPLEAAYVGNLTFNGVLGKKLIGNAVVTNDSPYEIRNLVPESDYQIDIRALSYLGTKGDWIRIPTASTDSLAALYTPFLTVTNVNVRAPLGDAGVFSEGGTFKVLVGNIPLTSEVYYRLGTLTNIDTGKATIDASGVYEVTEILSTNDSQAGSVELLATVTDTSVILITDGASVVSGKDFTITSLGTTSTANWVSAGFPAGVTPAVGISFTATGSSVGTGTVANTLVELSRDFTVGKILDRSDELTISIEHEIETSPSSDVYVVGPAFFKNNGEYLGTEIVQDIGDTLESHEYTITALGSGSAQTRWNTLFGTSAVTYIVGDSGVSVVDGSTVSSTSGEGTASTSDRNYRVRAIIKKGGVTVADLSTYTFSWFSRESGSATEVTLINAVLDHHTLAVDSSSISKGSEKVFRVSVSTP